MATNIYQVKVTNHYLDAECDEHSRIKRSEFYSKLELAENAYEKYLHSNDDNMYDYPTNEYYDVITITEITLDTNEQKCLKTSGDCICNIP